MDHLFTLSCESTVDLPYRYVTERDIPVIFYNYTVDGTVYDDDMGRDPENLRRFYRFIEQGKLPSTSQINVYKYEEYFEGLLQKSDRVLHIAMGSGMSPSVTNAVTAAGQLKEKYPDKQIVVIDSLCSCTGYGLLVDMAADLRDEGKTLDQVAGWVDENRHFVYHQFFSSDIKYFKRSGRVSGAAATVATILGICPIMRLNEKGRIIAYGKVRGKTAACEATAKEVAAHIAGGAAYNGKFFISHSNCPAEAEKTRDAILRYIPSLKGKIKICNIGTIIASHSGPGTVAAFFMSTGRVPGE